MYIWALKNILANMKTFFMRITRKKRNGELCESEVKYLLLYDYEATLAQKGCP